MKTTIRWTDGTETTQEWFTLFWWEAVKKARDRYALQQSRIAAIAVTAGERLRFFITSDMTAEEIAARMATAEATYRTELAAFNARHGLEYTR